MGVKKTHCKRGHALTPENRNHRDKCVICTAMTAKAYNKKYKEEHPNYWRDLHLKKTYQMSFEDQEKMLKAQNNQCAICKRLLSEPHVDHDHKCCPGKTSCGQCIRGLLCYSCNYAIGLLHDDPLIVQAATDYLKCWKAV